MTRVGLFTREYPPEVYGGAGVHVEYLARELRRLVDLEVHCWGAPREDAVAHPAWDALRGDAPHMAALKTMSIDLSMTAAAASCDVVHSHTWYANLAGHLSSLVYGVPHVATVHSLEPLRPWKAEQLGGGYALSSWCEKVSLEAAAAVVAVSRATRDDILRCYPAIEPDRVHMITNGIDTDEYAPAPSARVEEVLSRYGVPAERPAVVFVGRITRQKGVEYLVDAARAFAPEAVLVLCAGAPDTPEIGADVEARVAALDNVVWIREMLPKPDVIALLTHATVFACPSIYEPLGIVNLEAMACETAVVATATGGIVEVVDDPSTGLLVPFEPRSDGTFAPVDREAFVAAIATRVNELVGDPGRAAEMGRAGRARAIEHFSWPAVAERTAELYRSLT